MMKPLPLAAALAAVLGLATSALAMDRPASDNSDLTHQRPATSPTKAQATTTAPSAAVSTTPSTGISADPFPRSGQRGGRD